jgi:hypothetical protein
VQQQCLRRLSDALANWQVADVRTVPGVMYQVRCGHDELDPSVEYQINWFVDCTETFIHNHRHSFDSYCLEGEYIEKLWEIIDDGNGEMTYQFRRNLDSTFDLYKTVPGTLRHVKSRHHFPGNQLHVDTCLFHSITPIVGSSGRVLTFLVKRNYSPVPDMFVLSTSSGIAALDNDMRLATDDERQAMYEKLQQVLTMRLRQ